MTKVKSLVSTSIKVVNITELKTGDIYKRIIPKSTYDSTKVVVGIVRGVVVSEDSACFQCLELATDYGRYETTYKAFSSDEEILITNCSQEEFEEAKAKAVASITRSINNKQKELEEEESKLNVVEALFSSDPQAIENGLYQDRLALG